ncbi:hypothetical protein MNBD_GAMMA12-3645 [hydrothermal vent metagenome]|uniref:Glutaredoxin domain-containing protein n=1 Tax=hydrothermal vent metagenome TaxID=652676 RepID=A0A3B0YD46_9ZZZZ
MTQVTIYSTGTCPICDKAKSCLVKWNINYEEVRVDQSTSGLKKMMKATNNARTVPQIFVKDKWIGGFAELTELHMDGELDDLMA